MVYRVIPEKFSEPLPSIIITLMTILGFFFLFKPLFFKDFLPHDLQGLTIPQIGLREFGFTILVTFIDGIIDVVFKVKSGQTSVKKMQKDLKDHLEKSHEENYKKLKGILPTHEGVKRRN